MDPEGHLYTWKPHIDRGQSHYYFLFQPSARLSQISSGDLIWSGWLSKAEFNQISVVNMMELHHGSILAFVLRSSVVDQSCSALSVNTSLSGLCLTASRCWAFPFQAAAPGAQPSLDGSFNLTAEMDEQHPDHTCVTASTYTHKHTHNFSFSCFKETTIPAPFGYCMKRFSLLHTFLDRVAFTSTVTFFIPSYSRGFATGFFTLFTCRSKKDFVTHALRLLDQKLLGFFSKSVSWYLSSLSDPNKQ